MYSAVLFDYFNSSSGSESIQKNEKKSQHSSSSSRSFRSSTPIDDDVITKKQQQQETSPANFAANTSRNTICDKVLLIWHYAKKLVYTAKTDNQKCFKAVSHSQYRNKTDSSNGCSDSVTLGKLCDKCRRSYKGRKENCVASGKIIKNKDKSRCNKLVLIKQSSPVKSSDITDYSSQDKSTESLENKRRRICVCSSQNLKPTRNTNRRRKQESNENDENARKCRRIASMECMQFALNSVPDAGINKSNGPVHLAYEEYCVLLDSIDSYYSGTGEINDTFKQSTDSEIESDTDDELTTDTESTDEYYSSTTTTGSSAYFGKSCANYLWSEDSFGNTTSESEQSSDAIEEPVMNILPSNGTMEFVTSITNDSTKIMDKHSAHSNGITMEVDNNTEFTKGEAGSASDEAVGVELFRRYTEALLTQTPETAALNVASVPNIYLDTELFGYGEAPEEPPMQTPEPAPAFNVATVPNIYLDTELFGFGEAPEEPPMQTPESAPAFNVATVPNIYLDIGLFGFGEAPEEPPMQTTEPASPLNIATVPNINDLDAELFSDESTEEPPKQSIEPASPLNIASVPNIDDQDAELISDESVEELPKQTTEPTSALNITTVPNVDEDVEQPTEGNPKENAETISTNLGEFMDGLLCKNNDQLTEIADGIETHIELVIHDEELTNRNNNFAGVEDVVMEEYTAEPIPFSNEHSHLE